MKRHWKQAAAFFLTAAITLGSSSFAVLAAEMQTETKKAETATIELLTEESESEMTELLTEEAESEAITEQGTDTTSEAFTEATTEQGTDTTPEVSTGDASEDEPATEATSTPESEPTSEEQKTVEQTGDEIAVSFEEGGDFQITYPDVLYYAELFTYEGEDWSLGVRSHMKPGVTLEIGVKINVHRDLNGESSSMEEFFDFYTQWEILEGEDIISIEVNKEHEQRAFFTIHEDAEDGRKVRIKAHPMHVNEDGSVEELEIWDASLEETIEIDSSPYRDVRRGEDGKLHYYVDDVIDTEFEGIPKLTPSWEGKYYVKDGEVVTDLDGVHLIADELDETSTKDTVYVFTKGEVDEHFLGIAEYDGDIVYFVSGEMVTDRNGLRWVYDSLVETMVSNRKYYFTDGKVDTSFEGIVEDYGKYYVKDGTVATDMNGLHLIEDALDETTIGNVWYFFKEGQVDKWFEGVTEYNGGKFYIDDGTVATDVKGLRLVKDTQDETAGNQFYFFSQGQVQTQHIGLTQYDGAWFYVTKGVMDKSISGIVEYNGGKFIVAVGRICREVNGLWQDPKDRKWYFASNGQIQTQHTGVAAYDGALFYVINGELATDYEGTIKHNGVIYKVVNGQLHKIK